MRDKRIFTEDRECARIFSNQLFLASSEFGRCWPEQVCQWLLREKAEIGLES